MTVGVCCTNEALANVYGPEVSECMYKFQTGTPEARRKAVDTLGKIGNKFAIPFLRQALKDSDVLVRISVAKALGKMGDSSGIPILIEALKDKRPDVRQDVVKALGKTGDTSVIPVLREALKDENVKVRQQATDALVNLGDKSAKNGNTVNKR